MKLHIHFNNNPEQVCKLDEELNVGETATVHFHDKPEDCEICPNGHCHAPNVSISRIDEETVFLAFENFSDPMECDIKNLPLHSTKHIGINDGGEN